MAEKSGDNLAYPLFSPYYAWSTACFFWVTESSGQEHVVYWAAKANILSPSNFTLMYHTVHLTFRGQEGMGGACWKTHNSGTAALQNYAHYMIDFNFPPLTGEIF